MPFVSGVGVYTGVGMLVAVNLTVAVDLGELEPTEMTTILGVLVGIGVLVPAGI